ncbi:hypothetical protein [Prosthecobacter sp.]|jgi:hypothetical protein|uniref:hypothetical protein n=1 Tax=Prosthecobacter sp. TaxID=1965333 RepID=UPI0037834193
MNWQRAIPTSRCLAITVTLVTVMIMLTPLRRGPAGSQRQAGWMPLLNLGGMHDNAAFQRRQVAPTGFAASDTPLSRAPSTNSRSRTP